ncbi:hypothetical protein COO60DRAFT_1457455 [Scenedesmus sp. NREL 46B-D3]|nr:hypothetical protein COO60DRAFT_1457455 [Scenedesmus sp. NREL 46B-D3]
MSTKRGRKRALAKPAAPVVQDEEPEVTAAELQGTAERAAPPSPIVTLAKQAITPVVAAAKRAVSTIAAALPAVPEASAVDAAGLDFNEQHPDSPRSPTAQRNPFSDASAAAAVLEIALPQPAEIASVTFHHALGSATSFGSNGTVPGARLIMCSLCWHRELLACSESMIEYHGAHLQLAHVKDAAVLDITQSASLCEKLR